MKKITSLLLVLTLLLCITACSGEEPVATTQPTADKNFLVGFGRTDVTPKESVPLASYGDNRMSTGFVYPALSNAVAITDADGNTLILLVTDLSWGYLETTVVQKVSQLTGVPEENIIHCGTHSHSGVEVSQTGYPSVQRYNIRYVNGIAEAAVQAMENRAPAKIMIGSTVTKSLNFVRIYFREDGTVMGDNYGAYDANGNLATSPVASHVSEADGELQLIKFVRDGAKDIIMANFQTHPHLAGKSLNVSSENWGPFRESVEERLDVHCLVFNGAAGNLNSGSRIKSERVTTDFREWGKLLANYVVDMNDKLTEVSGSTVKSVRYTHTAKTNHTEDHRVADALIVKDHWESTKDSNSSGALAAKYKFNSFRHALAVVSRSSLPSTKDITIGAYSIGDVSFVSVPFEMFDVNGKYIKDNTPFEMTFICGYWGSQSLRYIPSEYGYTTGGYEADNSFFEKGTAEDVVAEYMKLLNQLHSAY